MMHAMPSPNNLPLQLTSFIGRERELADVKRLLGTSRLLTLTGAGGTGKTRLALHVASQVAVNYPDGVYFVNLAPLSDPDLVVSTIAQALDVKEAPGQPLIETLESYLQAKETLLLLDNFEQVLQAAPTVVDLLLAAPDLKVLVTSREPLHVQGEQQYHVPPLELPNPKQQASVEELSRAEAVALFIERAKLAQPDFDLTDENASLVAQICARLDGLPLAIELAAARMHVLTPKMMLSRLQSRLRLLTGGAANMPTRQQTLRATIDWSYNLLDQGERQLFRRMSVFQSGSTLEAVEVVCSRLLRPELAKDGDLPVDVLNAVQSLVSKGLLQRREGRDGEPRFWMLETIHEYAKEKLWESREADAIRKEHAIYFAKLAEAAEPHLQGAEQQEWLDRLEEEHDNIRAVLRWARESGNSEDTDLGLRLAGAVWRFWAARGHFSEGREALQGLLSKAALLGQSSTTDVIAKALNGAGGLAWPQGDYAAARSLHEQALTIRRALGDMEGIASSLHNLGLLFWIQGNQASARSLLEESLTIARELGDKRRIASSLLQLGIVALDQGEHTSACSLVEGGLAIFRELGDRANIAESLGVLGAAAFLQGDYTSARSLEEECLSIFRDLEDDYNIAAWLYNLGHVAHRDGDVEHARRLYAESLTMGQELGFKERIGRCLVGLGGVAGTVRQPQRGARLLGAAEALLEALGAVLAADDQNERDRGVTIVRSQLNEEAFAKLWEEGRAMSMEQAIAYALQDMPESEAVARPQAMPKQSYPNELSRREVEVLQLLALGLTNRQIAERLFLAGNTVRAHLYSIYSKLDVSNRTAAAHFVQEHRLM